MVARMSSEEFTEAWHTKRQMKRLEGQQNALIGRYGLWAEHGARNGMQSRLVCLSPTHAVAANAAGAMSTMQDWNGRRWTCRPCW